MRNNIRNFQILGINLCMPLTMQRGVLCLYLNNLNGGKGRLSLTLRENISKTLGRIINLP